MPMNPIPMMRIISIEQNDQIHNMAVDYRHKIDLKTKLKSQPNQWASFFQLNTQQWRKHKNHCIDRTRWIGFIVEIQMLFTSNDCQTGRTTDDCGCLCFKAHIINLDNRQTVCMCVCSKRPEFRIFLSFDWFSLCFKK